MQILGGPRVSPNRRHNRLHNHRTIDARALAFERASSRGDQITNTKKCKLRARRFLIEHRHQILKARGTL